MNNLNAMNPAPDQALWRYVDFVRFVSLLESQSLYFTRLDLLGDPFEGSVTSHDLKDDEERWMGMSEDSGTPIGLYEDFFRATSIDPRARLFVSCWHMSETESVAMWRLYSEHRKGIAIKTRVNRLTKLLPKDARVRCVRYIDYGSERTSDLSPIYCKRKAFEFEREVRAVLLRDHDIRPDGIAMPITLNELIEEIRLSPEVPEWIFRLVEQLAHRYGISALIARSELEAPPVFNWYLDDNSTESASNYPVQGTPKSRRP